MRETRPLRNSAERVFQDKAKAKGWRVTKRGWPDFLCWNEDGDVFVVEVKPQAAERLKKNQAALLQLFADHGIPAYRWSPDGGFKRVRTDPQRHARARSRVLFENPADMENAHG